MGDRGNIVIRQGKDNREDVWFYTHWRGSDIREVVATTLRRHERWSDGIYLARMIFCELVKGSETEATGFGISTQLGDNEYPILVVDTEQQKVFCVREEQLVKGHLKYPGLAPDELPGEGVEFEKFNPKSFVKIFETDEQ